MTGAWIAIGLLVFAAALVLLGVYAKMRSRGPSGSVKAKVEKALQQAVSQQDPVRRVLAADAVLDLTLTELGFRGSLGDKLKKAGPRIPTIQAVWDAHKLRNRLAHEHSANVNQAEVDRAVRILENAIRNLIS
jgi:hypothetical protein